MGRQTTMRLTGALGVVAAATVLAACGSSSDKSSSGAGATAPQTKIDAKIGTSFSGGKPGKASGAPITVGLINQEGGQVSDPEVRVAIQAAFNYLNAEQSGIGGRPLKLKVCNIVSAEEQGQTCAQQMLNDSSIDTIIQGGLNVGTQAVHQTIAGKKPVFITLANPGPDTVAKNTYALNAGAVAAVSAFGTYINQNLKAKKVAEISGNNPGDLAIVKLVNQAVESGGAKVKLATFPASSTDLVSPLTAAGAPSADAVLPVVVLPPACISAAKAISQLAISKPVVGVGLCATDQIKQALGDYPKWTFFETQLLINADDPTGQVSFYKGVMAKYAPKGAELSIGAPAAFGAAFAVAKVLNGVGASNLSPAAISKAGKAFHGPVLLGSPSLNFGSIKGLPSIGSFASRFYTYKGNGDWKSDSGWLNAGTAG